MGEEGSLDDVDPDLLVPEISNRLVGGLLSVFEAEYGCEWTDALIRDSGVPRAYLEDSEAWTSDRFHNWLFAEVGRRAFGLQGGAPWEHPIHQLWRLGGREAFTSDVSGPIFNMLRALGSPRSIYRNLGRLSPRANRLLHSTVEADEPGRLVVRCDPVAGYARPSHSCWDMVGLLEGVPRLWRLPLAEVNLLTCAHRGDNSGTACVYEIRYPRRPGGRRARVALLGLVVGGLVGAVISAAGGASLALPWGLVAALAVGTAAGWRAASVVRRQAAADASRMEHVFSEADRRYADLWEESQALRRSLLTSRKLSGFLASDLVERIVGDPEVELTLGGEGTYAAVLFADIVGFTPRCEALAPETIVDELNLYFSEVDPAIHARDGIIDKRMGDGIMAVFVRRAGQTESEVRRRAVLAGLDLQRAVPRVNAALAAQGGSPLSVRVGVAAGRLVLGNMGSAVKLEYTVIGDVVNTAARLEANASPGGVLVARDALPEDGPVDGATASERSIRVKGKQQAIDVVELRPLGP